MFIISRLQDDIRVDPKSLSKKPVDAITEVINKTFLDKVIAGLGLVVTIYDILSIEGGFIYPNDGAAFFNVVFRVVVFRPMVGQVLLGRVTSCSRRGVHVSLGFFSDVLVPEYKLMQPARFEPTLQEWRWNASEAGEEEVEMEIRAGDAVRLRVHSVKFIPVPTPAQLASATGDDAGLGTPAHPFAPMEIVGDMSEWGMSCPAWWAGQEEEGQEDDEMQDT